MVLLCSLPVAPPYPKRCRASLATALQNAAGLGSAGLSKAATARLLFPLVRPRLWYVCAYQPHRHGRSRARTITLLSAPQLDDEPVSGRNPIPSDFEVLRSMFPVQHSSGLSVAFVPPSKYWSRCRAPVIPVGLDAIVCGTAGLINGSARGLICGALTIAVAETKAPMPATFSISSR